ncbi:unnamed protein product [Arctogadus glacialis]
MESISMGPRYSSSWMFPSPVAGEGASRATTQSASIVANKDSRSPPLWRLNAEAQRASHVELPPPSRTLFYYQPRLPGIHLVFRGKES